MISYLRLAGGLVALALLAGSNYWSWTHGGDAARIECAEQQVAAWAEHNKLVLAERARRDAAEKRLRELGDTEKKVIEVIREHPSPDCGVSDPVFDSLRRAINSANASST